MRASNSRRRPCPYQNNQTKGDPMKPAYRYRWTDNGQTGDLSRSRAAYAIRAARSRRRQNITRTARHAYTLKDCSFTLAQVEK
jgi:hypothetical protein